MECCAGLQVTRIDPAPGSRAGRGTTGEAQGSIKRGPEPRLGGPGSLPGERRLKARPGGCVEVMGVRRVWEVGQREQRPGGINRSTQRPKQAQRACGARCEQRGGEVWLEKPLRPWTP